MAEHPTNGSARLPETVWTGAWPIPAARNADDSSQQLAICLAEQQFSLDETQLARWPFVCSADVPTELSTSGVNWRNDSLQRALGQAVEQLAEHYFDLAPAARRARWTELHAAAEYAPELQPRLNYLAAGLDVDVAALQDGDARVQTLLDELRTTYPLPAAQRAARSTALAREKRKDMKSWAGAAMAALRRAHDLPDLGRDYLVALERAPARSKLIAKHLRALPARVRIRKDIKTPERIGGVIGVVIVSIIFVLRLAAGFNSAGRSRDYSAPYRSRQSEQSAIDELNQVFEQQRQRTAQLPVRSVVSKSQWSRIRTEEEYRGARPFGMGSAFRSLAWNLQVDGCPVPASCDLYEMDKSLIVVLSDADFAAYQECLKSRGARE